MHDGAVLFFVFVSRMLAFVGSRLHFFDFYLFSVRRSRRAGESILYPRCFWSLHSEAETAVRGREGGREREEREEEDC